MYDLIVVGGGASGVMCAITARMKGKSVLLIDAGDFVGKKLLVTGNGRCNLTNINCNSAFYNQNIDKYLARYGVKNTLDFFEKCGLVWYNDSEGRVYPFSNSARSVVEVLAKKLQLLGVEILTNTKVDNIEKSGFYRVCFGDKYVESKNVVIATGGKTAEKIIEKFKIGKKDFVPSLCALMTVSTKKLSGTRVSDVLVTAKCGSQIISEKGEILFKDSGLSGIVVFNLSSLFARKNNFNGEICVNLMPNYTRAQIIKMITDRNKICSSINDIFVGWFAKEVANEIIKKTGLENLKSVKLSQKQIEKLANTITSLKYTVSGHYDNNQVYSGGVLLTELTENLESKKHKGLYFCGEVCDVDGICGGYNLQWAWTSGHIVGESV